MSFSSNLFSLVLVISCLHVSIAQRNGTDEGVVYFPNENGAYPQMFQNKQSEGLAIQIEKATTVDVNLEQIRGTSVYEHYVDEIISTGIAKLGLATNKLLTRSTVNIENVVFSPLSISCALALVLLGSNGVTLREITDILGLASGLTNVESKSQIVHEQFSRMIDKLIITSGFDIGNEVNVATAIFVQMGYPIRPLYKSTAEELYKSRILNVNFRQDPRTAQNIINNWVSSKTKGKISYILNDAPSTDTKVIITSALYFRAEWEHHFFEGNTRRRPFYVNGRKTPTNIEVEMMSNGGDFPYYRDIDLNCEIMGFPYKGNKSAMYVVMPFNSNKNTLIELEQRLTTDELKRLVNRTVTTGAVILFPKMKIESTIDLKETLKHLGVRSLFNPYESNLSLLSAGENSEKGFDPLITTNSNGSSLTSDTIDNTIRNSNNPTVIKPVGRRSKNIVETVGPRFVSSSMELESRIANASQTTLDTIRQLINEQSTANSHENPGLYADQVIHKVFMDITEKGTEAAAATSVSLSRDGSRVTFRVDVPFFFFIRNEETKTILFWGSVITPTPNFIKYQ